MRLKKRWKALEHRLFQEIPSLGPDLTREEKAEVLNWVCERREARESEERRPSLSAFYSWFEPDILKLAYFDLAGRVEEAMMYELDCAMRSHGFSLTKEQLRTAFNFKQRRK